MTARTNRTLPTILFSLVVSSACLAQVDVLNIVGDKVGIGTDTPATHVHVKGTGVQVLQVETTDSVPADISLKNANGFWGFRSDGLGRFSIVDRSNLLQVFAIRPQPGVGVTALEIESDGTVHIGIDLVVDGDLVVVGDCTEVDGACAPDYVFAPGYALMPLDELEKFVRENSHLPNIPSAVEIAESGVNVVELQMRLLEKIEELTLYTIEQERKLEEVAKQNRELMREVERMSNESL